MHAIFGLLMLAQVGREGVSTTTARPPTAASSTKTAAKKPGPEVAFEIRDIRVGSPEWRGKLMFRLQPLARHEGAAAWTLDQAGFKELLDDLQTDTRSNVLQAPNMIARVGEPARMTSEEAVNYVAALKRVADGTPNHASKLAFEPQVHKVHSGVRVSILSSRQKGPSLQALVVIEENRLIGFHTATYREALKSTADPEVVQASLLSRLNPNHPPYPATLAGTIQVPEVDSRRIEGVWQIPTDGALLVSLGPRGGHEKGLIKKAYEEHLIAITARLVSRPPGSSASPAARPNVPAARANVPVAR
jgi:hypothetical protein